MIMYRTKEIVNLKGEAVMLGKVLDHSSPLLKHHPGEIFIMILVS